jgi:hypothetical protein
MFDFMLKPSVDFLFAKAQRRIPFFLPSMPGTRDICCHFVPSSFYSLSSIWFLLAVQRSSASA